MANYSALEFKRSIYYFLPVFILCSVLFADFMPSFFGSYEDQRLLLALVIIFSVVGGALGLQRQQKLPHALIELLPFLLLVFSFLPSMLLTNTGSHYLVEPMLFSFYFLSFYINGCVLRSLGSTKFAANAFVEVTGVAGFFYAAMSITVYLFAISDNFSQLDDVIPWGFVNIRYWSHIATWLVPLFPLCLLVVSWRENRLWRFGVAFTAAMWWWILLMSSSRGSIVGLLAGFLVVWLFFGRAALPWIKLFLTFLVYGLIIWLLLSVIIPSMVFEEVHVRGIRGDSSGRMPLWLEAWEMSLQNFPFGMGPQSWLTHDILTDAYRESPKFGHPHNMYLMWAAEYGWVSIAALVTLCCVALRNLRSRIAESRIIQDQNVLFLVAFTASVTAAMFHAGVSAVFIAPGSMLVGLCVLSVFWALIKPEANLHDSEIKFGSFHRAKYINYVAALLFFLLASMWFLEVLRYREAMANDLIYYQNELSQKHLPRFWFHGNFPRHPSQMPDN